MWRETVAAALLGHVLELGSDDVLGRELPILSFGFRVEWRAARRSTHCGACLSLQFSFLEDGNCQQDGRPIPSRVSTGCER